MIDASHIEGIIQDFDGKWYEIHAGGKRVLIDAARGKTLAKMLNERKKDTAEFNKKVGVQDVIDLGRKNRH